MLAVANKLHCVISSETRALVGFVDARNVVEEIVVNSKSDSDGAILKGSLHSRLTGDVLPALELLVLLGAAVMARLLAGAGVTTARSVLVAGL